ncbi:hypothetical protein, partial [Methylobacterium radiotolerans]|uniref:hypothetical protein n=1 Tax=Methylobacterium radiotolerans TaxID=31998 RepID=UPI001FD937E1
PRARPPRLVGGPPAERAHPPPSARGGRTRIWAGELANVQGLAGKGFRCDAAYKVPPETWRVLIGQAKSRDPACLFAAETLGCTFEEARATAGAG